MTDGVDLRSSASPEAVMRSRDGGVSLAGVLSRDSTNCSSEPGEEAAERSDELDMDRPVRPGGRSLKYDGLSERPKPDMVMPKPSPQRPVPSRPRGRRRDSGRLVLPRSIPAGLGLVWCSSCQHQHGTQGECPRQRGGLRGAGIRGGRLKR